MFLVGGTLRDLLLGKTPKDIDVAFEWDIPEFLDWVAKNNGQILTHNEKFQTFKVKLEKKVYDFAKCRQDGIYVNNRSPTSVTPSSLLKDLERRDFTINAMAYPFEINSTTVIDCDKIIDPLSGKEDLKNRIIRTCGGNAIQTFQDDALRIIRAIRFHIVLGFELHESIVRAFDDVKIIENLTKISVDRIVSELLICFKHDTLRTLQCFERFPKIAKVLFATNELWLLPTRCLKR